MKPWMKKTVMTVTQIMPDCYKERKTLPLEPFDEETSITNTSRCLLSS